MIPVLTGDGVTPAAGPYICAATSTPDNGNPRRPNRGARRTTPRPDPVLTLAASVDGPDVKRRSYVVRVECPAESCGRVAYAKCLTESSLFDPTPTASI